MTHNTRTSRPTLETLEGRDAPATMVVAVFPGAAGLWLQQGTGWVQLARNTPSQVAVSEKGEVLADFDAQGLWYYARGACSWVQMTANDPYAITLASNGNPGTGANSDVFATFGDGQGLWRAFATPQRGRGTWQCLTRADASHIDAGFRSLAADFDANGLWTWNTTQGWYKTTAANPNDIALTEYRFDHGGPSYVESSAGYALLADFDGGGLWLLQDTNYVRGSLGAVQPPFAGSKWSRLSTADARLVDVNPSFGDAHLYAAFSTGLYRLYGSDSSQWFRFTSYPVGSVAAAGDGSVYATFPGNVHGWQRFYEGWVPVSAAVPVLWAVA
jgi:hypothetical protein